MIKIINILHNHLDPFLSRKISINLENFIIGLKKDKRISINLIKELSYNETRIIRTIIAKNMNVKDYYKKHFNSACLKRTT